MYFICDVLHFCNVQYHSEGKGGWRPITAKREPADDLNVRYASLVTGQLADKSKNIQLSVSDKFVELGRSISVNQYHA